MLVKCCVCAGVSVPWKGCMPGGDDEGTEADLEMMTG